MDNLSIDLYARVRDILLRCREFESNQSLRAIFVDERIHPFRVHFPEGNSIDERVRRIIEYLLTQQLSDGRAALPIFLEILADNYDTRDSLHHELKSLATEVSRYLDETNNQPTSESETTSFLTDTGSPSPPRLSISEQIIHSPKVLSWLHLADLQFRNDSDLQQMTPLFEDIQKQIDRSGTRPEFVVVTGDIAYSGQAEEYRYALRFFENLFLRLAINRDRLFFVPGNHDIRRENAASTELTEYMNFVHALRVPSPSEWTRYPYRYILRWGEHQIAICHFNTAITTDSSQGWTEQQRAYLESQIAQYAAVKGAINIALLHHTPEYLAQQGVAPAAIEALEQQADFVIHGHLHQDYASRVVRRDAGTVIIQGGSDYFVKQHPNCYNLVTLDFEKGEGTILFRRMLGDSWQADNKNQPGGQYTFHLSQRLITLWLQESESPWSPPLAGYVADTIDAQDRLGITTEVNAFSAVIASKELQPPLCLGLFGDWGSGKTFFMKRMQERIQRLAAEARKASETEAPPGQDPAPIAYCANIVQITFNAWHYVDANLWACLVDRIFEGLDQFTVREHQEYQRQHLLHELKLAENLLAEAECRKQAAEQHAQEVEEDLVVVRQARESKQMLLRDVLSSLSLAQVLTSEQQDELKALGCQLGLPQTYHDVEELDAALRNTRTLAGRLQTALLAPENRGLGFVWLIIVLILVPLLGIGVNALLNWIADFPESVNTVATILSQVSAFAVAVNSVLNHLLKRTTPIVDDLEKALAEARKRVQERRKEISEEEAQLVAELSVLKEKEAAALLALEQAQARANQAKLLLEELDAAADARPLSEFIHERVSGQEYKKHLGVISTIRRDLEILSNKLQKVRNSETETNLPCIDRIVLYIDDLDRCPEQRVVDVLQAVHLLLAFDLFVVVVGVDSRWLLRSLEEMYPTLQINAQQWAGWSPEEIWAWQSTSQNYLEKIFQIPYNLRPMEAAGFRRLVASILPSSVIESVPAKSSAAISSLPGSMTADPSKGEVIQPSETRPLEIGEGETQPNAEFNGPDEATREKALEPKIDLNPTFLIIEKKEQDFIGQLAPLIPTPRATKRFINIYRLIRATIPEAEIRTFIGDEQNPGEYGVVMVLLAILTGYPRQVQHVFRKLLSPKPPADWQALLATLTPRYIPNTEPLQYQNMMVPLMDVAEANQWLDLSNALSGLIDLPAKIEPYTKWTRVVGRFSFRVGRIANGDSVIAETHLSHTEDNQSQWEKVLATVSDIAEHMDSEAFAKLVGKVSPIAGKVFDKALDKVLTKVVDQTFDRTSSATKPNIRITHIEPNPPGPDTEGEYVVIENHGPTAQRMTGWKLRDKAGHTFEFPCQFPLLSGKVVKVWVRHGTNSATDLYWGRDAVVWNNEGDTAELCDEQGTIVSTYDVPPKPED